MSSEARDSIVERSFEGDEGDIEGGATGGGVAGAGSPALSLEVALEVAPEISPGCLKKMSQFEAKIKSNKPFSEQKSFLMSSQFFQNIQNISDFEYVFYEFKKAATSYFKSTSAYKYREIMAPRYLGSVDRKAEDLKVFIFGCLIELSKAFIHFEHVKFLGARETIIDKILGPQDLVRFLSLLSTMKKDIQGDSESVVHGTYQYRLISEVDELIYQLFSKPGVMDKISRSRVALQEDSDKADQLVCFLQVVKEAEVSLDFFRRLAPDLDCLLGVLETIKKLEALDALDALDADKAGVVMERKTGEGESRLEAFPVSQLFESFLLAWVPAVEDFLGVMRAFRATELWEYSQIFCGIFAKHRVHTLDQLIQTAAGLHASSLEDEVGMLFRSSKQFCRDCIFGINPLIKFIHDFFSAFGERGARQTKYILPVSRRILSGLFSQRSFWRDPPAFEKWFELVSLFEAETLTQDFFKLIAPAVSGFLKTESGEGDSAKIKTWIRLLRTKVARQDFIPMLSLFLGPLKGPIRRTNLNLDYLRAIVSGFQELGLASTDMPLFFKQAVKLGAVKDYELLKSLIAKDLQESILQPLLSEFMSTLKIDTLVVRNMKDWIEIIQLFKKAQLESSLEEKIMDFLNQPHLLSTIQTVDHLIQALDILRPAEMKSARHKVLDYFIRERLSLSDQTNPKERPIHAFIKLIDALKPSGMLSELQPFLEGTGEAPRVLERALGGFQYGDLSQLKRALAVTMIKPKGSYFLELLKIEVSGLLKEFLATGNPKTRSTRQLSELIKKPMTVQKIREIIKDSDDRDLKYQYSTLYRLFHGKRSPQAELLYIKLKSICNFCDGIEDEVFSPPMARPRLSARGSSRRLVVIHRDEDSPAKMAGLFFPVGRETGGAGAGAASGEVEMKMMGE